MRLTFRAKLMSIVGATAFAFLILILVSTVVADRVEVQLGKIQELYVPKVEIGPRLETLFERMRRGFQDAVAAHDLEALEALSTTKLEFHDQLSRARDTVGANNAATLQSAVDKYYAAAYDVSRRILAGETGEDLVESMAAMQANQAQATDLLRRTTAFDRRELSGTFDAVSRTQATAARIRLTVSVSCCVSVLLLSLWLSRDVLRSLGALTSGFARFGRGEFSKPIPVISKDELGVVAEHANQMAERLRRVGAERDRTDWLKSGQASLVQELRGELEPEALANSAVRFLARYLGAAAGALYGTDLSGELRLLGQYALPNDKSKPAVATFAFGEGLVGQAALQNEITFVKNVPANYLRVASGLGESPPKELVFVPLVHIGRVIGIIEFAVFKSWTDIELELLLSVRENIAIGLEVARARAAMRELLAQTQQQASRLSRQEEELRATNEELQAQQEELRQANEELTEQTTQLEAQRQVLQQKNTELDEAHGGLERKARELTTVSAYKSQFLANMSHELRTPLNSMLLLSNLLGDNEQGNLTQKQVEYSRTIHSAGKDLLVLINQVLDLSKVEAGKADLSLQAVPLASLAEHAERIIGPLARDKGLTFVTEIEAGLPETITTDSQRLTQILNNLLSNAVKFTDTGEVALRIRRPPPGRRFRRRDLHSERTVAFTVSDTGVGVAPQHQERIFAPFEQVEAASDRRYGGTGLGLSIARELTALLRGELDLESSPGKGSTFTCYLPYERQPDIEAVSQPTAPPSIPSKQQPWDDREALREGDPPLLIIEDDTGFAQAFGEIIHSQGLTYLLAPNGQLGLELAKQYEPRGIILDVKLPDVDGWTVMEKLRSDPSTASIPVHFVSAIDAPERAFAMGAVGFRKKPASRLDLVHVIEALIEEKKAASRRILVVDPDPTEGQLVRLLDREGLGAYCIRDAAEALAALERERFACIIVQLPASDATGLQVLQTLRKTLGSKMPPVIIDTARALQEAVAAELNACADTVVLEESAPSDRLLEEVRMFLRRLQEGLGPTRLELPRAHPSDVHLEGRKILIVDDDMRTVYALSATLRAKGALVHAADTGRAALAMLAEHPDIEVILMDIMMPEMNGYEAIRRIRQEVQFTNLPIIALTAKATAADKEECLRVGASDYLPKPIDANRLLVMLHEMLSKGSSDVH